MPILKRFYLGLNFKHRVSNRCKTIAFVGLSKQFGFNDAGPIGQTEEFHRLAGNLVMGALLDNQPASRDRLPDKFAKTVYRAIRFPGDIGEQFEWMAADSKTEQVRFPFQALVARWLMERDTGQLLQPWR